MEVGEEFGPGVGRERLAVNVHLRTLGHHFVAAMMERVAISVPVAVSVAIIAIAVIAVPVAVVAIAVPIAVTVTVAIAVVSVAVAIPIAVTVPITIAVIAVPISIAVAVTVAVPVSVAVIAVPIAISIRRPSKRTRRPLFGFFFGLLMPVYGVAVLLEAVQVLLGTFPHTRQAEVSIAVKDEGG